MPIAPVFAQAGSSGGRWGISRTSPTNSWRTGGTAREHIELTYRWDGKTLRNVAMWMVVFPYFVYNITCFEFQKSDNKFGRTTRHFWGFE